MDPLSEEVLQGLAGTQAFRRFTAQMLSHIEEVNATCLELLTATAHSSTLADSEFASLVWPPLLSASSPVRRRAAQQLLPLAEIEFRNEAWWQAVKIDPQRPWQTIEPSVDLPKRSAQRLARTTLILAWQCLNADIEVTRVLFSMSVEVASTIASLRFNELERIAEHQYRHVRLRWVDKPFLWVKLLEAASLNDQRAMRDFHLHALQLLAGESLPRSS